MCGRFTLQTPEDQIRQLFNLQSAKQLGFKPRYNITPSYDIPIIRDSENGHGNTRYGEMCVAPARLLGRSDIPNVIAPAWKPGSIRQTV